MKTARLRRGLSDFTVDNCTFLSSVALLIFLQFPAHAGPVTVIDFDGLNDGDIVTNQFPGLTFTNAIVLSAGISLNEFEFPPHSGTNVVSDNGGPISIAFATPVVSFGAYFTYDKPLTLNGFDSLNSQVVSAVSPFSSNDALFGSVGSSPNEFLEVTFAGGISSVTITGDPGGGSFVIDDVTYSTATTAVPESNCFSLTLFGALGLSILLYRQSP